jgi:hypothetical protein
MTATGVKTLSVNSTQETVDAFTYESQKQLRLKQQLESEGFQCIDDPAGLADKIGTVQDVEVYCSMFTPRLLCKLFAKGCENLEHSFFLVPYWQIVKWMYLLPKEGEHFTGRFIVGVRRVSETGYVPSLRLPLG